MLAAIAEQSDEVSAIVEDLLTVARTDSGELTVADVPVNLRAQTAQVLETLDQNMSITVHGQAPKASGDPARVRQILRNLFTNANRYGGDHISVELASNGDDLVSLIVLDDGHPIPVEDRERIFEAYQRAHNQPGRTESIGLGLAVSRRLARLMGGDLTYRHQNGHSIFELSLPVYDSTKLESHRSAVASEAVAAR
jgi:signal transduction histidine kinase